MEKVAAIIVTYNRKELLLECLQSLNNQTYALNKIIIIDNASTDGTKVFLDDNHVFNNQNVKFKSMDKNLGGAGGFYEGMLEARSTDCTWYWIMDDDTIPTINCLEYLIEGKRKLENHGKKNISYVASCIYGEDCEFMNVPEVDLRPTFNGYPSWYEFLEDGVISISSATFVSVLVNSMAVTVCGLPCKDYFIWGDDSEYTLRLNKYFGPSYLIGNSIAIHKRKNASTIDINKETNRTRLHMYSYFFRNNYINNRIYKGYKYSMLFVLNSLLNSTRLLFSKNGLLKICITLKGLLLGKIQYHYFKKYINNQITIYVQINKHGNN